MHRLLFVSKYSISLIAPFNVYLWFPLYMFRLDLIYVPDKGLIAHDFSAIRCETPFPQAERGVA